MAQTTSFESQPAKHERVNCAKAPLTGDERAISRTRPAQNQRRCIYCGQMAPLVWVHGHGQCTSCGINVDECCRGESFDFE